MPCLSEDPLDLDQLLAAVAGPGRGGTCAFLGSVRDRDGGEAVVGLEYTAYVPMAEAVLAAIVVEAEERWPVRVAVRHRVGELAVGEAAVAIAAAGAHRDEAFAACRYLIEEVKRRVPIWKRERHPDGTGAWVDPTAARAAR